MNKIKTFLVAVLATLALAGCNKSTSSAPVHEHAYVEVVTKEATCTEAGENQFVCECGDVEKTEVIPATGHIDTTTEHTAATLDTPAYDTVTCTCGETWTENEDAWTAYSAVYTFAAAIFQDPTGSVKSASLQDGTEVRYTGANFGTNLGTTEEAANYLHENFFSQLPEFDTYADVTANGTAYYAVYVYASDYTMIALQMDAYLSGTNVIIQVMSYLADAK